jgi:hypothetical protein
LDGDDKNTVLTNKGATGGAMKKKADKGGVKLSVLKHSAIA